MRKEVVRPLGLAEPNGFNHGVLVEGGQMLFLAGQIASGPDGRIVAPNDLVGQFEQVMINLAAVIREAGGTPDDIVKLNMFVIDRDDYQANLEPIGDIFSEYIDEYPAMALFEINRFIKDDALIEIEGFAIIDPNNR